MARAAALDELARGRRSLVASPTARLALAAATIGLIFGVLLLAPFPLWASAPPTPPAPGALPAQPAPGWPGVILVLAFVVAMCLPFRPYLLARRIVSAEAISKISVIAITAALALLAFCIYPAFGSDVFEYLGFERMWLVYGDNPLFALPIHHPDDWASQLVWYPDRTPAYGPLWALLTWPIAWLAGDSPLAAVLGYKLLALLGYVGCCWLLWRLADPSRRTRALVAFAWSPLVLFEVLAKAHNDVLPALAVLGALWLIRRNAFLPIAAGALVKATTLAVAPVIALCLVRRNGWRATALAAAIAALLVVGIYRPFWAGPATLGPLWQQTSRVVWSPGSMLIVPLPASEPFVRLAFGGLWLLAAVLILRRVGSIGRASLLLMLASVLLLSSAVYAHYFVPIVALAALVNDHRLERAVVWLSIGSLAAYAVELVGLVAPPGWLGSSGYVLLGSLVLVLPAVAAITIEEWRSRLGRLPAPRPTPAAS